MAENSWLSVPQSTGALQVSSAIRLHAEDRDTNQQTSGPSVHAEANAAGSLDETTSQFRLRFSYRHFLTSLENKLHLESCRPVCRVVGAFYIPKKLPIDIHGEFFKMNYSADSATNRRRPHVVAPSLPVCCDIA